MLQRQGGSLPQCSARRSLFNKGQAMAEAQGILVVGERREGRLHAMTAEGLAAARHLAEQGGHTVAVGLVGSGATSVAQEALQAGADRVYTVEDALLEAFH